MGRGDTPLATQANTKAKGVQMTDKEKPKKKATRDSDARALDKISKEKDPNERVSMLKKLLGGK